MIPSEHTCSVVYMAGVHGYSSTTFCRKRISDSEGTLQGTDEEELLRAWGGGLEPPWMQWRLSFGQGRGGHKLVPLLLAKGGIHQRMPRP